MTGDSAWWTAYPKSSVIVRGEVGNAVSSCGAWCSIYWEGLSVYLLSLRTDRSIPWHVMLTYRMHIMRTCAPPICWLLYSLIQSLAYLLTLYACLDTYSLAYLCNRIEAKLSYVMSETRVLIVKIRRNTRDSVKLKHLLLHVCYYTSRGAWLKHRRMREVLDSPMLTTRGKDHWNC